MIAVLVIAGCGSRNSPPKQVESDNPSVTYTYRGDEELVAANEKAITYCAQYQATPRTMSISDGPNGDKKVVFNCIARPATTTVVPAQPLSPSYVYRTDQELLDTSYNAASYCASLGQQRAVSTITTNPDGSRSVTFRCVPRGY